MTTDQTGRPGKYTRSAGGLVVALAVTVVATVVLLWVLGLFREDLEVGPEQVDYLATVAGAQDAGLRPVYPSELPEGWIATGAERPPGEDPSFQLRFLTDEERFVGVHQEADTSVAGLVAAHVDEEPTDEGVLETDDSVAPAWQVFTDQGGDTGYVAQLGQDVVLVWGSAPEEDLQRMLGLLTRRPVAD